MFKMPLSEILSKIKEKSGLSEEQINSKISEKLNLLSGLISKEGAAHIIANELGIKLFDQTGGRLQIKNILTGMRDVETLGKVQRISSLSTFHRRDGSDGKVASLFIADETGGIRVVLWGDQTKTLESLKEGDTIRVLSGYVRENSGMKEIHLNEKSKVIVNPEGEKIQVKEIPVARKQIKELSEKDIDTEILGTIVQVFDLRFFEVCPECGKRARRKEQDFECNEHGKIAPDYSYVLNLVLDDGTETIRTVFFRNNVTELLQIDHPRVLAFKDDLQRFEEMKNALLGEQIKAQGRVNKNEMFDRLEFMVRKVNAKPSPQEEIERLQANDVV